MPKRKSYTANFKLCVVAFAKDNGNRAAGRKYSVNEKSVREWRKEEAELEKLHPRKRARRGQKAKWPKLEGNLLRWVLTQRESNHSVSTVAIQLKARVMAMEQKIYDFKGGSPNWVYKFMRRNNLSVRALTSAGQRLPNEWEKKMHYFKIFVHKEIQQLGLKPNNIFNMDEVPMSFDIPATRSVAETGTKRICVATTGHERTCFTVVLACTANGEKLKPMVIFKRVMMPREKMPAGVCIVCNRKGWMNTDVMKTWSDSCFRARKGGFFNPKSLLVLDSLAAHKESSVQKLLNSVGAHIAIIPGGLTSKLQPLDMAVNHSFKCFIREDWDNWMRNGSANVKFYPTLTFQALSPSTIVILIQHQRPQMSPKPVSPWLWVLWMFLKTVTVTRVLMVLRTQRLRRMLLVPAAEHPCLAPAPPRACRARDRKWPRRGR
uniref:HTH CENPB-type domain-containing protein n=1 Tax=Pelodiscus sinensis TaxID=13735 RepID=K7GDI2_PELSI